MQQTFTVSVTVLEGKNLSTANTNATSFYFQAKIANSIYTSKQTQKTTSPVWNEKFSLHFDPNHDVLNFMLFDGNALLINEFITMKKFSTVPSVFWISLKQGAIQLKIQIIPKIFIRIIEAKNLPSLDVIGKTDPYVVINYGKLNQLKTHTVKHNLNPIWNEEFFIEFDETIDEINIKLFDYHLIKKHVLIDDLLFKISQMKVGMNDLNVKLKKGTLHLIIDTTQLQKPQQQIFIPQQQPMMMMTQQPQQQMVSQQMIMPQISQQQSIMPQVSFTSNVPMIPSNAPPELYLFQAPLFPLYKKKVTADFSNKSYENIASTIDDIQKCFDDLSDDEFEDLEEGCARTKYLNVEGNKIKDLTNLDDYDFLESVNLANNELTHLSSYRTPKTLIFMNLTSNKIQKLENMKEMSVRFLNISQNEIESISGIEKSIPNLIWLSLDINKLKTLEGIESFQFLRWAFLSENNLTTISLLPRCAFLLEVDLSKNQLKDEKEIIGLMQYTQVMFIDISSNLFNDQQKQMMFQFASTFPTRKITIKI
eukprot:gene9265-1352_t